MTTLSCRSVLTATWWCRCRSRPEGHLRLDDFLIELEQGEVLAANAAVRSTSSASPRVIYTIGYEVLHDAKIEALKEIVEASNEPVLIAYNFHPTQSGSAKR